MTSESTLSPGAQMVANRLRKNLKRLRNWRRRNAVTCYRAYDADLPEYAAAVDVYQEAAGEQRVFLHVQEYQAPASIPEATAEHRLGELVAAVVRRVRDRRLPAGIENACAWQGRQQVRAHGRLAASTCWLRKVWSSCG